MEILLETENFTEDLRIEMKGCISMCIIMFLVCCHNKSMCVETQSARTRTNKV